MYVVMSVAKTGRLSSVLCWKKERIQQLLWKIFYERKLKIYGTTLNHEIKNGTIFSSHFS